VHVVEREPKNAQAHYLLGQCYQNLGRLQLARSAYLRAVENKPQMFVAHYRLGTIAEALDQPKEADLSYRHAIRINPRFSNAFVNLGYLYLDHDYPEEALQVLKAGVAVNGEDASLHNALGMAYNLLKQYDQAIPHFEKAMKLKADLWVALYNIGVSYAAVDKRKKAEAALSRFARVARGRKDIDQAYVRAAYDKIAELRDDSSAGQSVPPSRIR
jgi:tetratricopeptide (TPR) repeat protein